METTESVANFFIEKAIAGECFDLTQMKLQKLVYYAHGWHLGLSGDPLFLEPVQAWTYGPVIYSLRKEFGEFGANPIDRKARGIKWDGGTLTDFDFELEDSERMTPFLQKIWHVYRGLSAVQLTNMTHAPGT